MTIKTRLLKLESTRTPTRQRDFVFRYDPQSKVSPSQQLHQAIKADPTRFGGAVILTDAVRD